LAQPLIRDWKPGPVVPAPGTLPENLLHAFISEPMSWMRDTKWKQLIVLLAEDDEHDAFFVQYATEQIGNGLTVKAVRHGEEAIRYLTGQGDFADRSKFPLPDLILTDLKMPCVDGFQLLSWLRQHPRFSLIPAIVFSSSDIESDVKEAYRSGANSFITKPNGLTDIGQALGVIYDYWSRCERPTCNDAARLAARQSTT